MRPVVSLAEALLLAVWLGGIAVLVFRLSIGQYRIWRMVRRAKHPPQWICGGCLRVAEAIGCRAGVEVLQSDGHFIAVSLRTPPAAVAVAGADVRRFVSQGLAGHFRP